MAKRKQPGGVDGLIDELLKLRTLGADTRADLEELRDAQAKGELDAADAAYVANLHARLKGGVVRPAPDPVADPVSGQVSGLVPANDTDADDALTADDDTALFADADIDVEDAETGTAVDWQAEAEHWRERAEAAEAELADLKDRHDALREELASVRETAADRTDPNNPG